MQQSPEELEIINTFIKKETKDNFSISVSYEALTSKNFSLSAGQYFDVKIQYVDITPEEFNKKILKISKDIEILFSDSKKIEAEIIKQLNGLKYE